MAPQAPPRSPARSSLKALLPDLGRRPLVMGILNVTPDSFSDGGRFDAFDAAVAQALLMVEEGADLIDIGGESTRPGHEPVSADEEQARVLPVIAALAARIPVPISIDTYKADTARRALAAGARIVNDVWGLQREPEIARVAAAAGAPVIVMHNRAEHDPALDILDEFRRFFDISLAIAGEAGIPDADIVLDPGIGFGKTRAQNMDALRRLAELKAFGYPVLVGASRKSLIGALIDPDGEPRPPAQRLHGTIAAHVMALARGADIIRVHDVKAHVDAARIAQAFLQTNEPETTA